MLLIYQGLRDKLNKDGLFITIEKLICFTKNKSKDVRDIMTCNVLKD